MNLKPDRRDEIELNMTPLIDVVFLLLIFFMVSTTFEKQARLKVILPEASAQAIQSKDKIALTKTVGNNRDIPLVLRADAKTPHQSVVMAMDAAAQLGLTRLSIATLESSSK